MSRLNHTFDTEVAAKYSIEEAVLIHHFQFWISKNKILKKNQKEGRTWTFQTVKEIAAHFPYWSDRQVERLLIKLIKNKILIKSNFNKTPYDHTIWYAFNEENKFISNGSDEDYKSQVVDSHDTPKSGNRNSEIGEPIPDTKKDIYINKKENKQKKKEKDQKPTLLKTSLDSDAVCDFLLKKIKEKNPTFKTPNKQKWSNELDIMIRNDKRSPENMKSVIEWAFSQKDDFWPTAILSPKTLRKLYDRAWMRKTYKSDATIAEEKKKKEKEFIDENKKWLQKTLSHINFESEENKIIEDKYYAVIKIENDKELISYKDVNFKEIIKNKLKSWDIYVIQ